MTAMPRARHLDRGACGPRPWRRRRCRASARRRSGSSGSSASQRASTTFCWLPPERLTTSWSGPAMRIVQQLRGSSRPARALLRLVDEPARIAKRSSAAMREVLADGERQEQRLLLAVLRHQADAVADRVARRADAHLPRRRCRTRAGSRTGRRRTRRARSRCGRRRPARRCRGSRPRADVEVDAVQDVPRWRPARRAERRPAHREPRPPRPGAAARALDRGSTSRPTIIADDASTWRARRCRRCRRAGRRAGR